MKLGFIWCPQYVHTWIPSSSSTSSHCLWSRAVGSSSLEWKGRTSKGNMNKAHLQFFVFVHLFSSFTWNILSSPPLASLVTQFKTSGGGGGIQTCMHRSTNALTAGWAMMEDRRSTKTSTISTKLWKQPLNSLSASNGDQKLQRLH